MRLEAPLHPIFVHFTIALTSASLAFDAIAFVFNVPSLQPAGWWALVSSLLMTAGTIVTGIGSRRRIPIGEGEARSFLRLHMALGPMFFGMLILVVLWRAELWQGEQPVGWWYLAALSGTVVVMTFQGYLGGELVYRYGMEVKGAFRPLPVRSRAPTTPSRMPQHSRGGGASSEATVVAPTAKQ